MKQLLFRRLQSMTDRRHLKPQRRQRSSANPLKSLQARDDLISEEDSNQKTVEVIHPQIFIYLNGKSHVNICMQG